MNKIIYEYKGSHYIKVQDEELILPGAIQRLDKGNFHHVINVSGTVTPEAFSSRRQFYNRLRVQQLG